MAKPEHAKLTPDAMTRVDLRELLSVAPRLADVYAK